MPRDLDLGSGHMAHHRASLIYLYLYAKFHLNLVLIRDKIYQPEILAEILFDADPTEPAA